MVSNALRLNLFKMYNAKKDKKIKVHKKEQVQVVEKTMTIEGMMCGHCESTVKAALEAIPGVEEAVASSSAGTAIVTLKAGTADADLKKAVEGAGYVVLGIE